MILSDQCQAIESLIFVIFIEIIDKNTKYSAHLMFYLFWFDSVSSVPCRMADKDGFRNGRIVGGAPVVRGSVPYIASLTRRGGHFCGLFGNFWKIISDWHVFYVIWWFQAQQSLMSNGYWQQHIVFAREYLYKNKHWTWYYFKMSRIHFLTQWLWWNYAAASYTGGFGVTRNIRIQK